MSFSLDLTREQGLILNSSIHAGIRAPLIRRRGDIRNDLRCGFTIITARDLDKIGIAGIIDAIKARVGYSMVYISVDIDVLDPAYAPGTPGAHPYLDFLLYIIYMCVFCSGAQD